MAPWMVIAALIGTGFVVLLIAPTLHRRINAHSRESAESARVARAHALRSSAEGDSTTFGVASHAVKVRDRLLLRGVRSEVIGEGGQTVLIYRKSDAQVVGSVMDELDIG